MKRVIAVTVLLLIMLPVFAHAEASATPIDVFVTVCTSDGIVLTYQKVSIKDEDNDGKLTINDALVCAHNDYYTGEGGYAYENTSYGIAMTRLWGVANGGAYGYCLNDAFAMSLADEVKSGDYICAYTYTDTTGFSDAYSYFDVKSFEGSQNDELALTLYTLSFDESFNPVKTVLKNAEITINGEKTVYKTDKDGKVVITLSGSYTLISATSDDKVIVPAVCVTSVNNDDLMLQIKIYASAFAVIVLATAGTIIFSKIKKDRKKNKQAV